MQNITKYGQAFINTIIMLKSPESIFPQIIGFSKHLFFLQISWKMF